jgi:hypothetical protein
MDCDCAMIECLYDFAPGRCNCARFAVGMLKVCNAYAFIALCLHKVCISTDTCFSNAQESPLLVEGGQRERDEAAVKPVVYIVPITSILGRLPLIPAGPGDHGTIPAALRGRKRELLPLGKCDDDGRQDTGSRLYYISLWAMCWPTTTTRSH